MDTQLETEVLIVGAGPTGLMAACQLTRFGINFIILDQKCGTTTESRALAVTPRSMELYQQLGLSEKILMQTQKIKGFSIFSNGKMKANISVEGIGKGKSEFENMMYIFEQNKNEEILCEYLTEHGQNVYWNTNCLEISQNEHYAEALVKTSEKEYFITSKYVIGCDGASSRVRKQFNFSFRGGTYEHIFFVADTTIENFKVKEQITLAPADGIFCAFFPLNGLNQYRIVGTLPKEIKDQSAIKFDDIKDQVKKLSRLDYKIIKSNWFSTYRIHYRCVENFRKGRIFLAGDSAHIHSPAGGQGMNTGLQDAHNLSWKLAMVIKGQMSDKVLESYNQERLPFAKWLLSFTDRGFTLMSSQNWFIAKFRSLLMLNFIGIIARSKLVQNKMYDTISQIWYDYKKSNLSLNLSKQKLKFLAGDRLPYIRDKMYQDYNQTNWTLIIIAHIDQLKINLSKSPIPIKLVYEPIKDWEALGVKNNLFVLLRPDQYIAAIFDEINDTTLNYYFRKIDS